MVGFPTVGVLRWLKTEEPRVSRWKPGYRSRLGAAPRLHRISDTRPRIIGKQANIFSVMVGLGMPPADTLNTAFMVAAEDLNYN